MLITFGLSLTRSFVECHMTIFHPHGHEPLILRTDSFTSRFTSSLNASSFNLNQRIGAILIGVRSMGILDPSTSSALMIGFRLALSRFIDFTALCIS